MKKITIAAGFAAALALLLFAEKEGNGGHPLPPIATETMKATTSNVDTATFAAGCFWCVEAVFQNLKGVRSVVSGYAGGHAKNPTYEEVCAGTTGAAEACQVTFDPKEISYGELLEVFWTAHDPTTPDRQGNDVGTQYRSAVFTHSPEQRAAAERAKKELDSSGAFDAPIVTEIVAFTTFTKAEAYHQNYYNEHGFQPYCMFVIKPKVEKIRKLFREKLNDK